MRAPFQTNPSVLTSAHTLSMRHIRNRNEMFVAPWEQAVEYLAAHAGRYVPGWELADRVYGGACSRSAVPMLITRARRYFRIESHRVFGYRIGRQQVAEATCPRCGALRVPYPGEWVCYGCPGSAAADLEVGRTPYAEGTRGGKPWTDEEREVVRRHITTHNYDQIGVMVNRSGSSVRHEVTRQGWEKKYIHSKAGAQ